MNELVVASVEQRCVATGPRDVERIQKSIGEDVDVIDLLIGVELRGLIPYKGDVERQIPGQVALEQDIEGPNVRRPKIVSISHQCGGAIGQRDGCERYRVASKSS